MEEILPRIPADRSCADIRGEVADEYALTLDPELSTYYLIDTIVNKLPHMIEHLAQLRAYGTGILAQSMPPATANRNQHPDLQARRHDQ